MRPVTIVVIIQILLFNTYVYASTSVGYAKAHMNLLESGLVRFQHDTGRYPNQEEGLKALNHSLNIANWKGPYLNKEVPLDPWDKEYKYVYPAEHGMKKFELYSFGKNRKDDFGFKDDISNWKRIDPGYYEIPKSIKQIRIIALSVVALSTLLIAVLFYMRKKRQNKTKMNSDKT